jgi:hypothetical protein
LPNCKKVDLHCCLGDQFQRANQKIGTLGAVDPAEISDPQEFWRVSPGS